MYLPKAAVCLFLRAQGREREETWHSRAAHPPREQADLWTCLAAMPMLLLAASLCAPDRAPPCLGMWSCPQEPLLGLLHPETSQ